MADFYRNIIIGLDGVETTVEVIKPSVPSPSPVALPMSPSIEYRTINDVRQTLRSSEAVIDVQVDDPAVVEDLFTEEARVYQVRVYRNTTGGSIQASTETLFIGWLQNDQFIEDYVNNLYTLTMRASDGLSELSNAEYTDEGQRLPTGLISLRKAVINCLNVTGLLGDVNFVSGSSTADAFPVGYFKDSTLSDFGDYFDLEVDQRVFRSDANSPEKCEEILDWILVPVNATVFQYNGEYFVVWRPVFSRPFAPGVLSFRRYNRFGLRQSDRTYDTLITLGSRVDGYDPFWANENQLITYRSSVGSAKMYYDRGKLASIIPNSELESSGGTLADWTVNQGAAVQVNNDNTVTFTTGTEQNAAITSSLSITTYPAGGLIQVEVGIRTPPPTEILGLRRLYRQRIAVRLETGSTTYFLDIDGKWYTSLRRPKMQSRTAPADFSFQISATEPTPEAGQFQLVIYPIDDDSGNIKHTQEATINFAKIGYTEEDLLQDARESFTVQQPASKSPVTYEPRTTKIGSWTGTRYVGSLLQPDGSQTDNGFRSTMQVFSLNSDLLRVGVVDAMAFESKIAKDFSGSIFGYIPYLSCVRINNLSGREYMIGGYTYDVVKNTVDLFLFEVFYQEVTLPPDTNPWYDTLESFYIPNDTGEVIEPPIRG